MANNHVFEDLLMLKDHCPPNREKSMLEGRDPLDLEMKGGLKEAGIELQLLVPLDPPSSLGNSVDRGE